MFFSSLALTVRYLTRRFIGEYRSKTDLLYRQTISLDSSLLDVEIVDVSAETDNEFPIEQIQWADSCLIVYSITDRDSFKYATRALANMKSLQNGPSAYLIANKADLDHLREVSDILLVLVTDTIFPVQYIQHCCEIRNRTMKTTIKKRSRNNNESSHRTKVERTEKTKRNKKQ